LIFLLRVRERHWIAKLLRDGVRLTNATEGGDGFAYGDKNPMRNPEAVARYIESNKGRKLSAETRLRQAEGAKRRWRRPGAKLVITGDNNPAKRPDVRAKISDGQRGIKRPYLGEYNKKRAALQRLIKASKRP
jgi:hypothetical protein